MSGIQGADISSLRHLSGQFGTEVTNLQGLISTLKTATEGSATYWKGPRADRFRSEWDQLRPTFEKFVSTLQDAQSSANTNATNIENATS